MTDINAIDRAIAAAQARRAAKAQGTSTQVVLPSSEETENVVIKVDDPVLAKKLEREAKKLQREKEREARRLEKEAKKAETVKKDPTQANHKRLEKAAEKLPPIDVTTVTKLDELKSSLTSVQLAALALHIQHELRVNATVTSASSEGVELNVGDKVKIISGDPKFVGQTGIVSKSRRIRCFVTVGNNEVYLFKSDVEIIKDEIVEETVEQDEVSEDEVSEDEIPEFEDEQIAAE